LCDTDENAGAFFAIRADLSESGAITALCTDVLDRFRQIDVLINAAVHKCWSDLLAPLGPSDAELSFSVNVFAPLRLTFAECSTQRPAADKTPVAFAHFADNSRLSLLPLHGFA
jgi:NAD(P)-dependent dehydrogenase (short-subunit alcohol dehydrogenase family)